MPFFGTLSKHAGLVLMIACAYAANANAQSLLYSIESLNSPNPNFVTTGNQVTIRVTAPPNIIGFAAIKLNGFDVTAAFAPNGTPGSITGNVPGLRAGDNLIQVFKTSASTVPLSTLTIVAPTPPVLACSALAGATGFPAPNTAITSATLVAGTQAVPEHCNIVGTINARRVGTPSSLSAPVSAYTYAINWQARLPTAWNGRFYMPGGGGTDGSVPATTSRLSQGYAVAANDSGHSNAVNTDPLAGGSASFGTDYQARVDFAYNAIDLTTQTGKRLVDLYYGKPSRYSYFEGCSMGGREAMMVTQRLPTYFDGVVVGDPAFRITKVGVWAAYEGQQLAAVATSMGLINGFGVPFANNTFTDQDLQLVSKAVLTACDALDGLVDGMVNNSQACTTPVVAPVLNALTCSGAKTAACLTAGQVTAITNIYSKGAPNSQGVPQYAPWMWDAGIAGCTSAVDCNTPTATNINGGWRSWNVGGYSSSFVPNVSKTANGALNFASLGGGAIPLVFATPPILPAPTANDGLANLIMNFNFDALAQSIFGTSPNFPLSDTALLNVDATNLSPFRDNGGKVLIYQPQTGGPFSPQDMVNWYTDMNRAMGGDPQNFAPTTSFARLFMMPGTNHCGGGIGTSTIDPFTPVVNWVENKIAPASMLGTAAAATPWPGRTRPLCPYPQYARYKGVGDINVAANFYCQ